MKKHFVNAQHWSIENGYQFGQKVEDRRRDFDIAWIRTILINSCTFEQSKDIQEVQSILHCNSEQADKLCSSLLWIRWIIRRAQEKPYATCRKQESRRTKKWKRFQNTVFWCNLKLAQQGGLQLYRTRSNAVVLNDTLPAEFIEKRVGMKTKDQLYRKGERDSKTACCSLGIEHPENWSQRRNCRMHGHKITSQS